MKINSVYNILYTIYISVAINTTDRTPGFKKSLFTGRHTFLKGVH